MPALDVRRKIVETVFTFESSKGHLRWSVINVAKAAKVSRSLVYYHFGQTKEEVLLGCLVELVEEFYGLTMERQQMALVESLILTHRMYRQIPAYAIFFQKWRHAPSKIQEIFLDTEARYERKLATALKKATPAQIKAVHAIFHGLVTAAYLDEKSLRVAVDILRLKDLV
jgi:AcrR family transcriptional regulator